MALNEFKFWCQKTLPLVYDDSLSYYELLCKLVNYLNNTMSDVNKMSDAFAELKRYVDNYFSDLNVQTEINNKLDDMVADGTINALLSNLVAVKQGISGSTLNSITNVALSYVNHNADLIYGHKTATRDTFVYQDVNDIDCSTFVQLVLGGVPYDASRYSGRLNNAFGSANFKFIFDNNLSWKMAEELYNRGLAFYPNADYSNILPGDILFYSFDSTDDVSNRFLHITHVDICLGQRGSRGALTANNQITVIGCSTYSGATDNPCRVITRSPNNTLANCVLVARLPLPATNEVFKSYKFPVRGLRSSSVQQLALPQYSLISLSWRGALQSGSHWTVNVNGAGLAISANIDDADNNKDIAYNFILPVTSNVNSFSVYCPAGAGSFTDDLVVSNLPILQAPAYQTQIARGFVNVTPTTQQQVVNVSLPFLFHTNLYSISLTPSSVYGLDVHCAASTRTTDSFDIIVSSDSDHTATVPIQWIAIS